MQKNKNKLSVLWMLIALWSISFTAQTETGSIEVPSDKIVGYIVTENGNDTVFIGVTHAGDTIANRMPIERFRQANFLFTELSYMDSINSELYQIYYDCSQMMDSVLVFSGELKKENQRLIGYVIDMSDINEKIVIDAKAKEKSLTRFQRITAFLGGYGVVTTIVIIILLL